MSEERRCQLKALLDEEWGRVEGAKPDLRLVVTREERRCLLRARIRERKGFMGKPDLRLVESKP